jgi:hypothetical protein
MTNTEGTEYRDDDFAFWGTEVLISICFRVTPQHEQRDWVVTSKARYADEDGTVEAYSPQALRAFAVEQLEEYGITESDINSMKS